MTTYRKNTVCLAILIIIAIALVLVFCRGIAFKILLITAILAIGSAVLDDDNTMNRE